MKTDVLLISPNQGSSFPWGILALGSYLTNVKKRKVCLINAYDFPDKYFWEELNYILPKVKLVGIGFLSPDVHFVRNLVDFIKQFNPNIKIILGGAHAVLQPEQTCRYKHIDFVAYSYGEETLDLLIDEINKDKPYHNDVPGLIYKDGNVLRKTESPKFVGFYDINYNLLPDTVRQTFGDYIQVLTGRGCPYRCRFCYISVAKEKFYPRSAKEIIEEVEKIVEKYNPKVIYFRDDNFFSKKSRVLEFIQKYKEKNFTFGWTASCRANFFRESYINSNLIRELESINCIKLKAGIESGSQRVLDYLRKDIKIRDIERMVVEIANSGQIKGNYSFMIGMPEETIEEYIKTINVIKFILKHEPDAEIIGPQYFRIYPGGSLYNEIVEKYGFESPVSFEDWSLKTSDIEDPFGLSSNVDYPWIPNNYEYLAMYSHLLIQLYKKPIKEYLTPRRFFMLFLAVIAKLRVKYDWYKYPYDLRIIAKLYIIDGVIARFIRSNVFLRQSKLIKFIMRQSVS